MSGFKIVHRKTNARGHLMGESHPLCRHSDEVVAQAREMRAAGATPTAIGLALGVCSATVWDWCNGSRRLPHSRIVVVRQRIG